MSKEKQTIDEHNKIKKIKINASEYFKQTKPVAVLYFKTLTNYRKKLDKLHPIKWQKQPNKVNGITMASVANSEDEISQNNKLYKNYEKYNYSENILCGSILQIAFTAIEMFSNNSDYPIKYNDIFKSEHKAIKFCIGREIAKTNIGLIIYAGRNQFVHWQDDYVNNMTKRIFEGIEIEYYNNPTMDLAYSLSNPMIRIHAKYIVLHLLKWKSYSNYINDMNQIIKE